MKWFKLFNSWDEAERIVPKGKLVKVRAGDHKICLAHTAIGFQAIADLCPHQGESLSKGNLNAINEVVCPWHAYRYSLKTGQESNNRSKDAAVYPIEEQPEGIFIGVGE